MVLTYIKQERTDVKKTQKSKITRFTDTETRINAGTLSYIIAVNTIGEPIDGSYAVLPHVFTAVSYPIGRFHSSKIGPWSHQFPQCSHHQPTLTLQYLQDAFVK